MADIKTLAIDFTKGFDFGIDGLLLSAEDGLDSAVIISLFTDARAFDDDRLPHGSTDRRGWWGDAFGSVQGDRIGSRFWLLLPCKQLAEKLVVAREYAIEALAWMIRDGVASRIDVDATNPREGLLALALAITKPDGRRLDRRYEMLWSA